MLLLDCCKQTQYQCVGYYNEYNKFHHPIWICLEYIIEL